jgi:hypothetical protein
MPKLEWGVGVYICPLHTPNITKGLFGSFRLTTFAPGL